MRRPRDGRRRAARRPAAAAVRLPGFERTTSRTACAVVVVDLPGRPLVTRVARHAQRRRRRASRPGRRDGPRGPGADRGHRARTTRSSSIEAAERLGASLHAEAGWDATSAGVDVPAARLGAALELLAEVVRRPDVPGVGGRAPPRRAPERPAPGAGPIRAVAPRRRSSRRSTRGSSPVSPARRAGPRTPVAASTADACGALPARRSIPARATLIVAGDVDGRRRRGRASSACSATGRRRRDADAARRRRRGRRGERVVRLVHRPGSVQTEIRDRPPRRAAPASRTSTPCRSWARSWAACSTRG